MAFLLPAAIFIRTNSSTLLAKLMDGFLIAQRITKLLFATFVVIEIALLDSENVNHSQLSCHHAANGCIDDNALS
jgi:hypothetical protein